MCPRSSDSKSVTGTCNLFHFGNFLLLAFLGKKVTFISRGGFFFFFGFISKHLPWLFCRTPKPKVLFPLFSFPSSVLPVILLSEFRRGGGWGGACEGRRGAGGGEGGRCSSRAVRSGGEVVRSGLLGPGLAPGGTPTRAGLAPRSLHVPLGPGHRYPGLSAPEAELGWSAASWVGLAEGLSWLVQNQGRQLGLPNPLKGAGAPAITGFPHWLPARLPGSGGCQQLPQAGTLTWWVQDPVSAPRRLPALWVCVCLCVRVCTRPPSARSPASDTWGRSWGNRQDSLCLRRRLPALSARSQEAEGAGRARQMAEWVGCLGAPASLGGGGWGDWDRSSCLPCWGGLVWKVGDHCPGPWSRGRALRAQGWPGSARQGPWWGLAKVWCGGGWAPRKAPAPPPAPSWDAQVALGALAPSTPHVGNLDASHVPESWAQPEHRGPPVWVQGWRISSLGLPRGLPPPPSRIQGTGPQWTALLLLGPVGSGTGTRLAGGH